jgi:glycerol transport system ATP-binding protein
MLELEEVSRRVGSETWLSDVSLRLERGVINVLLGPTLAGKTSLLRLMAGLDRPTTGRVIFDGVDVTRRSVRDRNVAMVYQQFINYPLMTVRQNIAEPLRLRKEPQAAIRQATEQAAELLRLTPYLDRRPSELSGGQQQRVAIARALVRKADLVLLDEPLANLDYKLREELRSELPALFRAVGSVVVYATTEPHEALLLGGRTACMSEGRIRQFGPTAEVYRRPERLTAAAIFSDPPLNTIAVQAQAGRLSAQGAAIGECRLPDGDWTLAFRPHVMRFDDPDGLRFEVEGVSSDLNGSESFIHVRLGDRLWTGLVDGQRRIEPGSRFTVSVAPEDVFVFFADGRALLSGPGA